MKGKQKSSVWKFYSVDKNKLATCSFCKNTSFKNNSTRMEIHLSKCKRCPPSIATSFSIKTSNKKSALRTEEDRNRLKALQNTGNNVDADDEDEDSVFVENRNLTSFFDRMSADEQAKCEKALARAIFGTGCSLSVFEHPFWKKAFSMLRPSFKIPTRQKISTILLEEDYKEIQQKVDRQIETSEHLSFQLDSWSNIRNEGITNIMVGTPAPWLIDSVESKEESQDHKYYVEIGSAAIDKYGPHKFVGLVTDNASVMKKCRAQLKEKYEWLIVYPCAMHGIQLLISFIMNLPTCKAVSTASKEVVKSIKRSHKLNAAFTRIRKEKNISTTLQLPGKTRFASNATSFQSLLNSKAALQSLSIDPSVQDVFRNEQRTLLLDEENFWCKINSIFDLIAPMKKWITILESDKPRFHLVYEAFEDIRDKLNELLTDSPLTNDEIYQIEAKLQELYEECVTDAHLAAYFLHPTTQGKKLANFQIDKVMDFLEVYAAKLGMEDVDEVSVEAMEFKTHSGSWASKYIWNCVDKIDPIKWWSSICSESKLQKIAVNLLSLPATSAPTERTFSSQGRVHSKPRNRLTNVRAAKLTYLSFNLKMFLQVQRGKDKKSTTQQTDIDGAGSTNNALVVSSENDGVSSCLRKVSEYNPTSLLESDDDLDVFSDLESDSDNSIFSDSDD